MIERVLLAGVDVQLIASVHVVFPNGEIVELPAKLAIDRGRPCVTFDQRVAIDLIYRSGDSSRRLGGSSVHEESITTWKGDVRRI